MPKRKKYDLAAAVKRLESIHTTAEHIEEKKSRCEDLLARAASLTSGLSGGGKSTRSTEAKHAKLVQEAIDLEKSIEADCLRALIEKTKIINEIYSIENEAFSKFLIKRYVENKDLKTISEEMSYSYDYIRHMHVPAQLAYLDKLNTQ